MLILVGKQDTVQKYRVGSESRISGVSSVYVYREECKTVALCTVMTIVMHGAENTSLSLMRLLSM